MSKVKEFEQEGLQCFVRQLGGIAVPAYHTGYVALPDTHDLYEKEYDDFDIEAHGGITYTKKGENSTWVLGFDTVHIDDTEETQSLEYVVEETKKLAERLAKGEYNVRTIC